jgi:hypothetical protein
MQPIRASARLIPARTDLESGLEVAADWPWRLVLGARSDELAVPARIVSLFALLVLQVMPAAAGARGAVPGAQTASSTAGAITGRITDATGA